MRYLNKFNEDKSILKTINSKDMTNWGSIEPVVYKPFDKEYTELVFIDFIESGSEINLEETNYGQSLWVFIPRITKVDKNKIENHLENIEKNKEILLDLQSCFDKLKDDHKNITMYIGEEYVDHVCLYEVFIKNGF